MIIALETQTFPGKKCISVKNCMEKTAGCGFGSSFIVYNCPLSFEMQNGIPWRAIAFFFFFFFLWGCVCGGCELTFKFFYSFCELTFKFFYLKWVPWELRERCEKGVLRVTHPPYPFSRLVPPSGPHPFLGKCPPFRAAHPHTPFLG